MTGKVVLLPVTQADRDKAAEKYQYCPVGELFRQGKYDRGPEVQHEAEMRILAERLGDTGDDLPRYKIKAGRSHP